MCGRYTLRKDLAEFIAQLNLLLPEELQHPRQYNIAPSHPVLAIVADPTPRIEIMEWGFIPSWARPDKKWHPVINARGETISEKPYFRGAFRNSRCAILADGFYEWKKIGSTKQPYWISLKDDAIFAMAGVWSARMSPEGSERISSAIITTSSNEMLEGIHHRMPVILPTENLRFWLDRNTRPNDLMAMLRPYPSELMEARPVSSLVNSPQHNSPDCIQPLAL